jgi:predicted  nucleic acid-binding Zn-ribbon protein
MAQTSDRYARLCRSYIKLSDKFQKLDVEHMTLKSKVVPLLKALKAYKQLAETLQQTNHELEAKLADLQEKYDSLKVFEVLMTPEVQAELTEAEEQMDMIEETMREMEEDSTPDLSEAEKELLEEYHRYPEQFGVSGFYVVSSVSSLNSTEQEGLPFPG